MSTFGHIDAEKEESELTRAFGRSLATAKAHSFRRSSGFQVHEKRPSVELVHKMNAGLTGNTVSLLHQAWKGVEAALKLRRYTGKKDRGQPDGCHPPTAGQ